MLIVCSGPDFYRAHEKALELEAAFRQKFDPEGTSVEQLFSEGAELIEQVVERVNTVSLFTPRRFLRVRDLLKGCPKARLPSLEKALSMDPDNVIVLSLEGDIPTETVLKTVAQVPKFVRYDFPQLSHAALVAWIEARGKQLGFTLTQEQATKIAERSAGDTWQASLELLLVASGTESFALEQAHQSLTERNFYEWADAYLQDASDWRAGVEELGAETLLYPFLSQLRAYARVQANQDNGLPSFVVRKFKQLRAQGVEEKFARLLETMMLQRQGFLREDELATLF